MEEHKMQWLIDRVKNGEVDNVIAKTGKKKGSVVAPTGYGKFGFICEDIIYHIQNMKKDDKYIFNIAAPILLLELQCINDLSVVLGETLKEMVDNKEFMFFVNSSDNHSKYKDVSDKILAEQKLQEYIKILEGCCHSIWNWLTEIPFHDFIGIKYLPGYIPTFRESCNGFSLDFTFFCFVSDYSGRFAVLIL